MNMLGVGTIRTDRQRFSYSQKHESAGILFMDMYKEMSIEKKVKRNKVQLVLQSFQLQFEVIVSAVMLASSSEQQCPDD